MTTHESNSTFRGRGPTWANACVGNNGSPDAIDYASGFATAANALLDAAIAGRGLVLSVDTLIYPICFNMRHAVELFLKTASVELARLATTQRRPYGESVPSSSHDLALIWAHVKAQASRADLRFEDLTRDLDRHVLDIAHVDPTGQVFRYPFDLGSKKHLTELAIINVLVLKQRFTQIERLLHDLRRLIERLHEEYAWGTFTRTLSRYQLEQVARELPPRASWSSSDFDQVKATLKQRYGVGSRELSTALDLIQQRHEFAAAIGSKVEVSGLSNEILSAFFDEWSRVHDLAHVRQPPAPKITAGESMELEKVLQWEDSLRAVAAALMKTVAPPMLAALRALYYFRSEPPFSEAFERLLRSCQSEAEQHDNNPADYKRAIYDLLSMPLALEYMLYSLNFLGQKAELEFLINRYELTSARDRLVGSRA